MNNPAGQQALYNALHSVLGYLTPYVAQDVSEKRGLHHKAMLCFLPVQTSILCNNAAQVLQKTEKERIQPR